MIEKNLYLYCSLYPISMSYDQVVSSIIEKILIPFVAKSVEPIASKLGEKAAGKIDSLYNMIKSKFLSDSNAAKNLDRFENNPEGYKAVIEDLIKEKFDENSLFRVTVLQMAKEIQNDINLNITMKGIKSKKDVKVAVLMNLNEEN
jgi:hypothetical protein